MPSTTFFNLPEEKRKKLLDAACAEFARVSFSNASINKMIRTAEIPRGSFYQYFHDKEELFRYIIGDFSEQLMSTMEALLEKHNGDIFAALLGLFDRILAECRNPTNKPVYQNIIHIIGKNQEMGHNILSDSTARSDSICRLCAKLDRNLLDLRSEKDLEDMLLLLAGVTGPGLIQGILAEDPDEARRSYTNILSILARGMRKTSKS